MNERKASVRTQMRMRISLRDFSARRPAHVSHADQGGRHGMGHETLFECRERRAFAHLLDEECPRLIDEHDPRAIRSPRRETLEPREQGRSHRTLTLPTNHDSAHDDTPTLARTSPLDCRGTHPFDVSNGWCKTYLTTSLQKAPHSYCQSCPASVSSCYSYVIRCSRLLRRRCQNAPERDHSRLKHFSFFTLPKGSSARLTPEMLMPSGNCATGNLKVGHSRSLLYQLRKRRRTFAETPFVSSAKIRALCCSVPLCHHSSRERQRRGRRTRSRLCY